MVTLEQVLDKIAESIIESPNIDINPNLVQQNQKTIRNGIISIGRSNADKMVLFQKDIKANSEDLTGTDDNSLTLSQIVNNISDAGATIETTIININALSNNVADIVLQYGDQEYPLTNILNEIQGDIITNPLNVSQFINIVEQQSKINIEQANEFLDTEVYELLPEGSLRQEQINKLYVELQTLLSPNVPDFYDEFGRVERNDDGQWVGSNNYYLNNDISAPQDNPNEAEIDEQEAYITRLSGNASSLNSGKTIEDIYNLLDPYLKDINEEPVPPIDERPEYRNQSSGYLKFRNLNQGIIIRNTDSEFVEGLNPDTEDYLDTGFTISMWVRFLDKTSQGTLFNFGNPTRLNDSFGFKLETYVINGNDTPDLATDITQNYQLWNEPQDATWKQIFADGNELGLSYGVGGAAPPPTEGFFSQTDTERFVRLVVRDKDEFRRLRGSHVGMPFMNRRDGLPEFGYLDEWYLGGGTSAEVTPLPYDHQYGLMTNTRVPIDFNEWYFIVATYNPNISEDSFESGAPFSTYARNSDFWRNNIDADSGEFVANSGFGAKCKVEIISKTDLLRARGFKVD